MKINTYNHHLGRMAIKESMIQPLLDSLDAAEFKIIRLYISLKRNRN